MIKKVFPIYFMLLYAILGLGQTVCNNGMAGTYPCSGYDLMSRIPLNTLGGTQGNLAGSDIWGWTDSTSNKEYAIIALSNSTAFVDISNPTAPIFLGRLPTATTNSNWRDVKIYKNHAFIVADNVGTHGMQVFDLTRLRNVTNPPANFTADTTYTNGVASCHNIVINESTGVAYLVGCSGNSNGGPIFLNVSDPKNPVSLGVYTTDGYSHDAQVVTYNGPDSAHSGREIYIGSNENKVVVLDVTDKNNVRKLSEIAYTQIGYTHQGWFTEDQRYFILGDETDEQNFGFKTRTLVFDLQDLDAPRLSSTYLGTSNAIDHNGYVKGNEFFLASYRAGIRILDITNIGASSNAMKEIGYFDTYPENNNAAFNGVWSIYPYFASGNIIISDIEKGLFVIRKSGSLGIDDVSQKTKFSIVPNPVSSGTTITSHSNKRIQSIKIFSILGKQVFSVININQKAYTISSLNHLSKGIYLVKINNSIAKKLVIK